MRDARVRLQDIIEAIERIEKYAKKGRSIFEQEELIQYWCIHHLQIVGEAAAKLGRDFHEKYPVVPWAHIIGMRNILVHDYFGVDQEAVWQTIERDLPVAKRAISDLLHDLE